METSAKGRDGLYLMLLGTTFFVLFGIVLMNMGRTALFDFRTAYYSGVCLLSHCDPYNESAVSALYAQRHERWPVSDKDLPVITRNIYLPPAFVFTIPLALLTFNLAQSLWFLLILCSFVLAAFSMAACARSEPLLAGVLIAFCLANSGSLIYFGNPAGFVVPLCILAAWCFLNKRFVGVGIVCLAVGLAFKPHDVGFVWLYFVLAGGGLRTRALASFGLSAALSVPALLWLNHVAPNWPHEIAENFAFFAAPGSMNDPSAGHGSLVLTNLQTITSFFWADPPAYNRASYLVCTPFFIIWGIVALRAPVTRSSTWLGLAAIAPLSMLPVYHRQYDAKLILLAVPACALLWSRRGKLGWIALLVTSVAFFLNGDLPWVAFLTLVNHIHPASAGPYSRLLTAVWDFPVPLSLFVMGTFYLWVYAREARMGESDRDKVPGKSFLPEPITVQ